MVVTGLDWRVQSEYPGDGGCRLLIHDLDGNGVQDLIFLTANGGSGPAGLTMAIIAFDRARRPVPWQATGPFNVEGDLVLNFVDLDGDGKVELLFQHVEEVGADRQAGISTALYTMTDGYFLRATGTFGGNAFPIREPARARFVDEPNLTNAATSGGYREQIGPLKRPENGLCWLEEFTVAKDGISLALDSPSAARCRGYLQAKTADRISIL